MNLERAMEVAARSSRPGEIERNTVWAQALRELAAKVKELQAEIEGAKDVCRDGLDGVDVEGMPLNDIVRDAIRMIHVTIQDRQTADARVAELEDERDGACEAVRVMGVNFDAADARVAVLEGELLDGMPAGTNTNDPVPQDQKSYRVWTRSRVIEWERGPNVWLARDDHDHEDAAGFAVNCDGWLAEPDQGEVES